MRLRWLTAGESHGQALVALLDGMCADVPITVEEIGRDLQARSEGAGRSARQQQEKGKPLLLAGVRNSHTTGAPIAVLLPNQVMGQDGFASRAEGLEVPPRTVPRPGHADLAGALKRPGIDLRDVAERASARETAARTACGTIAAAFLRELGIRLETRVKRVAGIEADGEFAEPVPQTPFGTGDQDAEQKIDRKLAEARQKGEGLGGIFEVIAENVPAGLGDYTQWDLKLDGRLAQALMSIPAVKAVEVGDGVSLADATSTEARDPIEIVDGDWQRPTNRAGGIEGGVSNGMPIRLRAYIKPVPGVKAPVPSVDMVTNEPVESYHERHDHCVVRAGAVIGRAMVALVLADALLIKYGGDTLAQVKSAMTTKVE